jgi:hypothetical protein
MKLFERAGRPTPHPGLDGRLRDIFDDRRTPSAPEALYAYLREVPMDSSEKCSRGRVGLTWHGLGRVGRAAATLAAVVVVGAGLLAVTVGLPRSLGVGSNSSATPAALPSTLVAPAGWSFVQSFGDPGSDGLWTATNILPPASRIAIHVVCNGPDNLIVQASTAAGTGWLNGGPTQAATFRCDPAGHESRVELTAPSGAFQEVAAIVVRSPSSTVDTTFVVSIEVPLDTPEPSASS